MSERIWKKITYYAKRNTAVRILAIGYIAVYIFIRNVIRSTTRTYRYTDMRGKVAFACAVCLAFVSVFPMQMAIYAEESVEEAEPQTLIAEIHPSDGTEFEGETACVLTVTNQGEEETVVTLMTDDELNITSGAQSGSSITMNAPLSQDETATFGLTSGDGEPAGVANAEGNDNSVFDGTDGELPTITVKDGNSDIIAEVELTEEQVQEIEAFEPDVAIGVSDEAVTDSDAVSDMPTETVEMESISNVTNTGVAGAETVSNEPLTENEITEEPEEEIKEAEETEEVLREEWQESEIAEQETETTDEEIAEETEEIEENEAEQEEDTEETEEKRADIISVTLPTTFSIPMFAQGSKVGVQSEQVVLENHSEFPVDVNITSVTMTVQRSTQESKIYQAVVDTESGKTYDLTKEAEAKTCHLTMEVKNGGVRRRYRIEEGENEDITTFTLGTESADRKASLDLFGEATHGREGWDEGDLNVKITFDFRKIEN